MPLLALFKADSTPALGFACAVQLAVACSAAVEGDEVDLYAHDDEGTEG